MLWSFFGLWCYLDVGVVVDVVVDVDGLYLCMNHEFVFVCDICALCEYGFTIRFFVSIFWVCWRMNEPKNDVGYYAEKCQVLFPKWHVFMGGRMCWRREKGE